MQSQKIWTEVRNNVANLINLQNTLSMPLLKGVPLILFSLSVGSKTSSICSHVHYSTTHNGQDTGPVRCPPANERTTVWWCTVDLKLEVKKPNYISAGKWMESETLVLRQVSRSESQILRSLCKSTLKYIQARIWGEHESRILREEGLRGWRKEKTMEQRQSIACFLTCRVRLSYIYISPSYM